MIFKSYSSSLVVVICSSLLISLYGCVFKENNLLNNQTSSKNQTTSNDNQLTNVRNISTAERINKISLYLEILEENGFSGAVLVSQNDKIIFENGYGLADRKNRIPITPKTVFDSGSLSKQFTAAAILHLEEQGKLKVEDTLAKFFHDVPSDKAKITLHQLLTHSSGLPEYAFDSDFAKLSRQQAQKLVFKARLKTSPGTKYLYSDTGYGLLAIIVEVVSGKSFQDYLKDNLFKPANMLNTGFYNDPQWSQVTVAHGYNNGKDFGSAAERPGPYWGLVGFGGVLTTVEDLYFWNIALEKNLILSRTSTKKLFAPHIKENKDGKSYYGYGWVTEEIPGYGKIISHDGATDSQNAIFIKYADSNNTVVIVLSNRIDEGWFGKETFYGTQTGETLGINILRDNFRTLPDYAN
ncbi:serine hydrolase domain-containing protein [Mastigocoleus testarum]|uniref:Beta-lactamase-related domain-containing protein n=1 Tax=Mastigocoleus testarum BC008 TaxID=371196 RepID=A0A0V7ZDM1_9CYAN|nr:serine hydrolase domain-containing protein [Mastigocoleus testarum]KST62552.1 hypothetical protein BC008_10300 [Mastigocoleus testarum BC008]KST62590.1 hypothetical protein BC008_10495 [Mastigocoleus testarum BC008]